MNIDILLCYGVITFCVDSIWLIACFEISRHFGFCMCNPRWIYKHTKANWFGTALLTILVNLLFGLGSIIYWFYKLCTVGRKT